MTAPYRVLIVDDNADHRFLTRRAISSLSSQLPVESVAVASGADALTRLADETSPDFDLVLLDLKMPGMDGLEVLARLREHAHTRDLPVVLFSSSEQGSDRSQALAAGANAYAVKPIGAEAFLECVRRTVLEQAHGRREG